MTARQSLQVDIIVDTMCPWCFLGKRRLDKALTLRPDIKLAIKWRPYQLDASIPRQGMARKDYLARKFGSSNNAATHYKPIIHAGKKDNIAFAFNKIKKSPNTLDSHRLIYWAASAGCQGDIVERLFELYFIEGADIGDRKTLLKAAENVGMDPKLVAGLLASNADLKLIKREIAQAREIGIQGVPTYIFANKFANDYVLAGVQEPAVLIATLDQLAENSEQKNSEQGWSPH